MTSATYTFQRIELSRETKLLKHRRLVIGLCSTCPSFIFIKISAKTIVTYFRKIEKVSTISPNFKGAEVVPSGRTTCLSSTFQRTR